MEMRRKRFWLVALVLALVLALWPPIARPAEAATYTVNTVVDENDGSCSDGDCSLRDAIILANTPGPDTISFNPSVFPLASPATINILSPLPSIGSNTIIDGSNTGVILDGSGTPEGTAGLVIDGASNVMIKGLQILNFPGDGTVLQNGASNNTIGGTNGSPGGACNGDCNLISDNNENGVLITGSGTMSNTISGNLIGLDLDGTVDRHPQALAISPDYAADGTIFVGTEEHGVFKFTNGSGSWTVVNTGLTILNVQALAISPDYAVEQTIFAGTVGGGVFKSTDGGSNWVAVNTGLSEMNVQALAISPDYEIDQTIFAGTDNGIFKSTDGGSNWTAVNNGLTNWNISALAISPSYVTDQTMFASTRGGGVFKSNDRGLNWAEAINGLTALQVSALGISPSYTADQTIFAGTEGNGVFGSTDGGGSWVSKDLTDAGPITVLAFSPNYATDQTIFVGTKWEGYGVCKSTDRGSNWIQVNNGLANPDYISSFALSPLYATDQIIFLSVFLDGIFKSADGGSNWTSANNGLTELGNYGQGVSINGGAQWNTIGGDTPGERNIISNNSWNGISISDAGTDYNTVIGNYIGTDATGSTNIGNAAGVYISNRARQNIIGGTRSGERNVISGNNWGGVGIEGSGTMSNTVIGNFIGTDATGSAALGNNVCGVGISDWGGGAQQNRIGGTTEEERNIISGNRGSGVWIYGSGTMSNTVSGNYIGTNTSGTAAISNAGNGVTIGAGGQYNVIGGDTPGERNLISGNSGTGVYVEGNDTIRNTITQNAIYSNAGKGIELSDGGNMELFPPILSDISNNAVEGQAPPNSTVEIFSDADDEGRYFHGSTAADASGRFAFTQTGPFTGANVTATATDGDGNTSEFSAPYEWLEQRIYLPIILKSY